MKKNRFERGSGCFTCGICGRLTRDTGDNASVELCPECYELCGIENHLNDYGTKESNTAGYLKEAKRLFDAIAKKGGKPSFAYAHLFAVNPNAHTHKEEVMKHRPAKLMSRKETEELFAAKEKAAAIKDAAKVKVAAETRITKLAHKEKAMKTKRTKKWTTKLVGKKSGLSKRDYYCKTLLAAIKNRTTDEMLARMWKAEFPTTKCYPVGMIRAALNRGDYVAYPKAHAVAFVAKVTTRGKAA